MKPAWMHKDFRYAPSSPEAVRLREAIKPDPANYVPDLQKEVVRLRAENAEQRSALTNPIGR